MKKLFFFSLAVLLSMTSCTLENSISPMDQEVGQEVALDAPDLQSSEMDETNCSDLVTYHIDEGHPCGFYLFWEKRDMIFVPKSSEMFQSIRHEGTRILVDIDEQSMEPEFCEDRTGISINCVSLTYQNDKPVVKRSDLVD